MSRGGFCYTPITMMKALDHETVARWFFLLVATGVIILFWHIIEPFAIVLLTAGIAAVVVTPIERRIRRRVRHAWISSALSVLFVFLVIVGPLTAIGILMVQQALDIAGATVANPDWVANFKLEDQQAFLLLPAFARHYVTGIDFPLLLRNIAEWASNNIATVFSGGAALIFKTFIFFVCLYFFLLDREKIVNELISLSPFKDSVDRNIFARMAETVRGIVFGSLIVSVVQGVVAGIGFTIFGIPGALIWAAVVVVASQVPTLGTSVVTGPAILYLFLTGHVAAAIGLLLWATIAVGLVDNMLQPFIVGSRTRMHALLILLAILGGIEFFGPIGFILGPTVLAAFLVVLELYKSGILEKRDIA
jgi:predicted PurR-regulated permease PerM